ncbi:hypothetical protein Pgy4_34541, partial [Pseudomonas savastanoi pv. glycinea str. race 4]
LLIEPATRMRYSNELSFLTSIPKSCSLSTSIIFDKTNFFHFFIKRSAVNFIALFNFSTQPLGRFSGRSRYTQTSNIVLCIVSCQICLLRLSSCLIKFINPGL